MTQCGQSFSPEIFTQTFDDKIQSREKQQNGESVGVGVCLCVERI